MARARRQQRHVDYWPGFVDALATLLMAIIFLLSVFVVAQFVLSREVTSKDTALDRLNAQIAELTESLAMERTSKRTIQEELSALQASLATAEAERDRLRGEKASGAGVGPAPSLTTELDQQREISDRALAQVEILNQQIAALRQQIAALEDALDASEARDRESQAKIADLGSRLNVALAQRVQELARYRSDFFGRLREILADRPDIRIEGDRFVFPSEVFFAVGSAEVSPSGLLQLDKLAELLKELETKIPDEIAWVLRVDGHTDKRPVRSPQFPSNWELSAARAIAVVKYLISKGISPERLVAAGFGEFQPIDKADTEEAYAKNRRLELKLTEK